jgi:uncharacterized protein YpiB (UPF0302 family)
MPRTPAPLPPITPLARDLTVDDVRSIIETAERAQERRAALARDLQGALDANDVPRVKDLARQLCNLEKEVEAA